MNTVIRPQPGNHYSFKEFFKDEEEIQLLVLPFVPRHGHPSFVVREQLQNGKLLFVLFDPTSDNDAEQEQLNFQQATTHLFNVEPGMFEWRQIIIPSYNDSSDRFALASGSDRFILAAVSVARYLSLWSENNTLFHDDSVLFKFVVNTNSASLATWARNWVHCSLVAKELLANEEESVAQAMRVVREPL